MAAGDKRNLQSKYLSHTLKCVLGPSACFLLAPAEFGLCIHSVGPTISFYVDDRFHFSLLSQAEGNDRAPISLGLQKLQTRRIENSISEDWRWFCCWRRCRRRLFALPSPSLALPFRCGSVAALQMHAPTPTHTQKRHVRTENSWLMYAQLVYANQIVWWHFIFLPFLFRFRISIPPSLASSASFGRSFDFVSVSLTSFDFGFEWNGTKPNLWLARRWYEHERSNSRRMSETKTTKNHSHTRLINRAREKSKYNFCVNKCI